MANCPTSQHLGVITGRIKATLGGSLSGSKVMKVKIKGPVKKALGPASFPTLPITPLWLGPDFPLPSPTRHQALSLSPQPCTAGGLTGLAEPQGLTPGAARDPTPALSPASPPASHCVTLAFPSAGYLTSFYFLDYCRHHLLQEGLLGFFSPSSVLPQPRVSADLPGLYLPVCCPSLSLDWKLLGDWDLVRDDQQQ